MGMIHESRAQGLGFFLIFQNKVLKGISNEICKFQDTPPASFHDLFFPWGWRYHRSETWVMTC